MNTTDYIFIDFPIKNYLYGTQVKEISVRKSLSKLMRFLRKLPIFSKFISNTQEITDWDTQCKGAHAIILFDTFVHYSTYCKKIEEMAPKDARLILYLLNPAFSPTNTNYYLPNGKFGPSWRKMPINLVLNMVQLSIIHF